MEKEAALATSGKPRPGGGKRKKKEKGWREASSRTRGTPGSKAEPAVIISSGNPRSHIQEHFF